MLYKHSDDVSSLDLVDARAQVGSAIISEFRFENIATAEELAGRGQHNLQTNHGPLDVLCQLDELGYDELLPRSIVVTDSSISLHVLDLPTLIEVKTKAGRPSVTARHARRAPASRR